MKADRSLEEVRDQFWMLQREVGTLATDALRLRPTWRLVLNRKPLRELEARLDKQFTMFMNTDADLAALASGEFNAPLDMNSLLLNGVTFQIHFGVRDSVRGVLTDTSGILNGLRNQLDFRSSLAMSLVALVISLISLVAGLG